LLAADHAGRERRHHDLFQRLWVRFSPDEYEARIERYTHRFRINGLADGFLAGRSCIDFGCGHGNFAHALLRAGAAAVCGVDFGEDSIAYATAARDRLGVPASRLTFRIASVYDVGEAGATFDFAVQNGVFHHLQDEDRAYRELHRVLKVGGWAWIYTDGAGAVSHDLWDASVFILRDVPADFVLECLDFLNVETNKRYHLGDSLNAVYRHTTWDALTERLGRVGFGSFRRLVGGFPTEFDHDAIAADPYGVEKFGSGDLRLLAQKLG
jgi:SAM-dependent methyltransferase